LDSQPTFRGSHQKTQAICRKLTKKTATTVAIFCFPRARGAKATFTPADRMTDSPPPLFTLTGNLLAERTLMFPTWATGLTQRATAETFQVGGKGINVAKMLTRLGVPNTALGFTGGSTGEECLVWLRRSGLAFRAFPSTTPTRTGTVIRSSGQPETTFLGPDAPPDAAALRTCAHFLDDQPDGLTLALCGSFPGWTSPDFDVLRATLTRWIARGTLVADTYGPALTWLIARPVALVKINADELRAHAPDLTHLPASAVAQRWIVTDGPRLIQLRDQSGPLPGITPPQIEEISATGSGDVFLACMLHAWCNRGYDLSAAVKFALPYAAANAAHPGIAEFPEPALPTSHNFTK
jgi:fructose-1-phosphate kinase PfkB-like protein